MRKRKRRELQWGREVYSFPLNGFESYYSYDHMILMGTNGENEKKKFGLVSLRLLSVSLSGSLTGGTSRFEDSNGGENVAYSRSFSPHGDYSNPVTFPNVCELPWSWITKTLFTWSGGPRSSGVSFFCFVPPRAWKQKKPTPLDQGPPLHVNRP